MPAKYTFQKPCHEPNAGTGLVRRFPWTEVCLLAELGTGVPRGRVRQGFGPTRQNTLANV